MLLLDLPTDLACMLITVIVMLSMLLDHYLGEPTHFHPLVGFGNVAQWLESQMNKGKKWQGAVAWGCAVVPITGAVYAIQELLISSESLWLYSGVNVAALYLTVGQRSLLEHANWIYQPLKADDLEQARVKIGWIVSRDTELMDSRQISSSTIESVLENGNDAIFGALFWFALLGAPGAVLFRLVNTLDAMWGYKTERWKAFGYVAAKLDDLMGWLPARLTAISYALLGNTEAALRTWLSQARHCSSPNGGPVMTSGAGALGIKIGGDTYYHGQLVKKIVMGQGSYATMSDIPRAIKLVINTSKLWLAVLLAASVLLILFK